MNEKHQDLILYKRVRRIAEDHNCSIADVNTVLDQHPIEVDRDKYLKRTLALELLHLDEIEEAFREKALLDRDVASAMVLIKAQSRRAALIGLDCPIGHAVAIVQHPPEQHQTGTDRIEAVLKALREEVRKNGSANPEDSADPDDSAH